MIICEMFYYRLISRAFFTFSDLELILCLCFSDGRAAPISADSSLLPPSSSRPTVPIVEVCMRSAPNILRTATILSILQYFLLYYGCFWVRYPAKHRTCDERMLCSAHTELSQFSTVLSACIFGLCEAYLEMEQLQPLLLRCQVETFQSNINGLDWTQRETETYHVPNFNLRMKTPVRFYCQTVTPL